MAALYRLTVNFNHAGSTTPGVWWCDGYRKVHTDMRALSEQIGISRAYRLMHTHRLKAQVGYRKPRH